MKTQEAIDYAIERNILALILAEWPFAKKERILYQLQILACDEQQYQRAMLLLGCLILDGRVLQEQTPEGIMLSVPRERYDE